MSDIHDAVLAFIPFVVSFYEKSARFLVADKIAVQIESMIYGVYSVLFFLCIYIIWNKPRLQKRRMHLISMIALYVLATVHMVLMCTLAFKLDNVGVGYGILWAPIGARSSMSGLKRQIFITLKVLFFISNLLADSILIYRCYLIWGMNVRVIIFPVVAYICTIASFPCQFSRSLRLAEAALITFLSATFVTNVVTVLLTGGRIWWITRKARKLLDKTIQKRYNTATAVILESGILYPGVSILAVITAIFSSILGGYTVTFTLIGIIYHVVGIAPTLIIVLVGLGVTHDDIKSSVGSFHAAGNAYHSHGPNPPVWNRTSRGVDDIQTRMRDESSFLG
ncbi:hypothetical protein C8J56DRAFT_1056339 [Mycena floridula]|nr:hypothetical protein C8J56DRAFT_1056339 [Mycena floridula]